MSARRGRKKAPVKRPQQNPDADDEILNPESASKSGAPTPPPSPFIALVAQAVSPIVTAVHTARAVSQAAAAALPTIPETQAATAEQALDVDHGLAPTPGSPAATHNPFTAPATSRHTRSRLAGLGIVETTHDAYLQQRDVDQQSDQADDLQQLQDQNPQTSAIDISNSSSLQWLTAVGHLVRHYSTYLLFALLFIVSVTALCRLHNRFNAQIDISIQQQQQIMAQATLLKSLQEQLQQTTQQLQQRPDQQQLNTIAAACSAGLDQLNSTQSALHSSMWELESLAQQLAGSITTLEKQSQSGIQAWEALANATAARQAAQQSATMQQGSFDAQQLIPSSRDLPLTSFISKSSVVTSQQPASQQQVHKNAILESLPGLVHQEVHQQLTAKLPPLDLALVSCGAQVVFHTPAKVSSIRQHTLGGSDYRPNSHTSYSAISSRDTGAALLQSAGAHARNASHASEKEDRAADASSAVAAGDVTQRLQSWLQWLYVVVSHQLQLLFQLASVQMHMSAASNTQAALSIKLQRSWQQQQQQLTLAHVSRLLLSPAAQIAGRCVSLKMKGGAPAVLEIALPQMMEVHSVTLYYPISPGQADMSHDEATSWFSRAPRHVSVELVNSSSCRTASSSSATGAATNQLSGPGLCSMAAVADWNKLWAASITNNITDTNGSVAATRNLYDADHEVADANHFDAGAFTLAPGVVGVPRSQDFTIQSLMALNGRSVIDFTEAAVVGEQVDGQPDDSEASERAELNKGGVYADRVVVMVSASIGENVESVCLQRISVQGKPTDVSAFC